MAPRRALALAAGLTLFGTVLLVAPSPALADDYDDEYDDGDEDFAEFEAFQKQQQARAAASARSGGNGGGGGGPGGGGGGPGGGAPQTQEAPPDMVDTDDDCLAWAAEGECDANPEWMVPNCGRSCFDQFMGPVYELDAEQSLEMVDVAKAMREDDDDFLKAALLFARAEALDPTNCEATVGTGSTRFRLVKNLAAQCESMIRSQPPGLLLDDEQFFALIPPRCHHHVLLNELQGVRASLQKSEECAKAEAEAIGEDYDLHMRWFHTLHESVDAARFAGDWPVTTAKITQMCQLVMPRSHPLLWAEASRCQGANADHGASRRTMELLVNDLEMARAEGEDLGVFEHDNFMFRAYLMLPQTYANTSELAGAEAQYEKGLGVLERMEAKRNLVLAAKGMGGFYGPPPIMALGYLETNAKTVELIERTSSLVYQSLKNQRMVITAKHAKKDYVEKLALKMGKDAVKSDTLKVGWISMHAWNHAVGRMMLGMVKPIAESARASEAAGTAPKRLHMTLVDATAQDSPKDEVRNGIKAAVDKVVTVDFGDRDIGRVAKEIAKMKFDVIVYTDLGMDWQTYLLSFSRLAPVQLVTHGHPVTPGVPAIDYFVSYDAFEPPCDAHSHYAEALVTLPGLVEYPSEATSPPNLRRAMRRLGTVGAGAWAEGSAEVEVGADGEASGGGGGGGGLEADEEVDDEEERGMAGVDVDEDGSILWNVATSREMYDHVSKGYPGLRMPLSEADVADAAASRATGANEERFRKTLQDKIIPGAMDDMVVDILARDPEGVAVLLRPMLSDEPPNLREHLRRDPLQNPDPPSHQLSRAITRRMQAAALRVDPDGALNVAGRVLLIDRIHPRYYFALIRDGVVLDSYPYGGYTTSLDALLIGSPVITLQHPELARGRATGALLTAMELPELIAADQAEFVEIALRLGRDLAWYTELSKRVVARLPDATKALGHVSGDAWVRLLHEVSEGSTPSDLYAPKSRVRSKSGGGACDPGVVPLRLTL